VEAEQEDSCKGPSKPVQRPTQSEPFSVQIAGEALPMPVQRVAQSEPFSLQKARSRRMGFVREMSSKVSLISTTLGISIERQRSSTQVGLRGDKTLYDDLKDFVKMD
jgi:hypothetical protein